jgi:hypothetical protein
MWLVYDNRNNEAIQLGLEIVRSRVPSSLLATDWLSGGDPVWKGIHEFDDTGDGRSFRDTAHCIYPFHAASPGRDLPMVIMPEPVDWWVVVHELGHVIDYHMGFTRTCEPCTEYARTDRMEAFAEAFTAYCSVGYADISADDRAFFDSLRAMA